MGTKNKQVPKSPEPVPTKARVPKIIKKRDREVPTGDTPREVPKTETKADKSRVLNRALKADKPMGSVVRTKDDAATLLWDDTHTPEQMAVPTLTTKEQVIAQLWG